MQNEASTFANKLLNVNNYSIEKKFPRESLYLLQKYRNVRKATCLFTKLLLLFLHFVQNLRRKITNISVQMRKKISFD